MTHHVESIVVAPPAPAPVKFGVVDLALVLMTVIWGMNAVIVKLTYAQIPPPVFMAVRFVIAGSLLLIILRVAEGNLQVERRDWPMFIATGIVGTGLYQPMFLTGLAMTSASVTALIIATSPVFVALINRVLGRELLPLRSWLGIGLTFAGIVLIVNASGAITLTSQSFMGDLLILAGSLLWALYAVLAAPLMVRYSPLRVTALTTAIGAAPLIVIGLPATLALDWGQVNLSGWSGLLYSAIFAIVVGYIIWNIGVKKIGGTRTALYNNLIPVVSVVAAIVLLDEHLTPLKLAGAVVILFGLHLARTAKAK